MELTIEILTGKRKGREISIQRMTSIQSDTEMPYLLETEGFALHLKLESLYDEVALLLNDINYQFFYKEEINNSFHYILMPKRNKNGYEALFYNYFGTAYIDIKISLEDKIELIHFAPVDVLARKLTADQAAYMIEYILKQSEGDLHCLFSATRSAANYIDGGEHPKKVINKLKKVINILEEFLPSIVNRPLTRVSSETRMQNGYQAKDIDEQGLGWLNENLSVLEETDDFERSHVYYDGTYYLAREVQIPVIVEHTDIYENRVIYGFLLKLKHFALDIERHLVAPARNTINSGEEGYSSFFSVIGNLASKMTGIDSSHLINCNDRITVLIKLLDERVPITMIDDGLPILTQKVKSNRFYASVFRAMVEWYRYNKIDWRSQEILLAIKSIPILFEYYTVLKVREELISICENIDISSGNLSMLSGVFQKCDINLYYEPHYWMVGHQNIKDAKYLRTEISENSFSRTAAGNGFKPSNHKNSKRVPDIVIEVIQASGDKLLLIFDAKYSTMEIAYKEYLRNCAMKYIHGIHGIDGSSPVNSMILICPTQSDVTLADMHAPPYGLFDDKAVFPIIGVQGVDIIPNSENNIVYTIGDTIKRLLHLVININNEQSSIHS